MFLKIAYSLHLMLELAVLIANVIYCKLNKWCRKKKLKVMI